MRIYFCFVLGLIFVVAGCNNYQSHQIIYRVYERVGNPQELPYHFTSIAEIPGDCEYEIRGPIKVRGHSVPGGYLIQNYAGHRSRETGIVFYPRIESWEPDLHLHPMADEIMSPIPYDMDADSTEELVVFYRSNDSLILEALAVQTGERMYRRFLATGIDRNGDGKWDGCGYLKAIHDMNNDGHEEFIISCEVGRDLYPRQVMCLDWYHDSLLWIYPIAGSMGVTVVATDVNPDGPVVVFGISSKGNSAVAGDMDDHHSYLVGLDGQGRELFRRPLAGEFTVAFVGLVDYDADGQKEIVVGHRYYPQMDSLNETGLWSGIMKVVDFNGLTRDSIDLGPGKSFRNMRVCDFDGDGKEDVLASFSDSTIVQYDRQLQAVRVGKFYTSAHIWAVNDFLGNGRKQMAIIMNDNSLCMIDDQFHLLAQIDIGLVPTWTRTYPRPRGGLNIVGTSATDRNNVYFLGWEKTPWLRMVYLKYKLYILLIVVALCMVLVVSILYQQRIRRHLRLIANQKQELEIAHRQLQEMQARVLAAEKHRQAKVIAGGVAHEIHNALCPAANALDVLKHTDTKSDDDDSSSERLIDLSQKAIARAMRMTSLVTEYSRLEATRKKESILLRPLLNSIVDELTVGPDTSSLRVAMDIPDDYAIVCSPAHAHALFNNILKNAVEAMAELSRKEIRIKATEKDSLIRIEIIDTGPGLPEDIREHIFEPFVTSRPNKGTGLGLTIARRIAELYDGDIAFENILDGGAKCSILIPKPATITGEPNI